MGQVLLIIVATIVVSISIYKTSVCTLRRAKNYSEVGERMYVFISKVRYYPVVLILVLLSNLTMLYLSGHNEDPSIIYVSGCYIVIAMFDFVLSVVLKPTMYEEGILTEDGILIDYNDIKSIRSKKSYLGKISILSIEVKNSKTLNFYIYEKDLDNIRENVFNKSGVIFKDIVTDSI